MADSLNATFSKLDTCARHLTRPALVLTLAISVVTACSQPAVTPVASTIPRAEATATPTKPPPPESTPEPTLSAQQQLDAYRACRDPYAKSVKALNKRIHSATSLKKAKKVQAGFAQADATFGACVRAVAWTPPFDADARALVKALRAVETTEQAMSEAKTNAEYFDLQKTFQKQSLAAASAANLLRDDLAAGAS